MTVLAVVSQLVSLALMRRIHSAAHPVSPTEGTEP